MFYPTTYLAICLALLTAGTAVSAQAQDSPWAVYVMKPDGSEVRRVAQAADHFDHSSPRWSHDGKRIAFDAAGQRGKREVFVVNADGSDLTMLGNDARPDWSPDDKQIVQDVYGSGLKIVVQNLDGSGRDEIASGVCGRWSPDGSRLAVTDHRNLRIVDLVSGEEREVFEAPFDNLYAGYNWSPDGKLIALTGQTKDGGGARRPLVLVDVAGAEPVATVRMESGQGGSVSFSPDGKRLVLDNKYLIQILDIAGNSRPSVVPGQKGKNKDPHWSPDGQWIVFCSDREE